MKKYRINTTISNKHHELLLKHTEEFGTQRNVLEHALESIGNNLNQNTELSPEEELWMRMYKIIDLLTVLPRDFTKTLFETIDLKEFKEYIRNEKPVEFAIEWCYNRPLKECSLQELIEGIFLNIRTHCLDDTINYAGDGDYYTINMMHALGINGSKALLIMYGSVFNSYGVKFQSNFSERSIYFKVFKSSQ